jgi:hypothetical protein
MLPHRVGRLTIGAALALAAGILAWQSSSRPETGYIAFTATIGALLAVSRYLGERPNFAIDITPDDWPGVGDTWRFVVTNRSDREWLLTSGFLSASRKAKSGLGFDLTHPMARMFDIRVQPYDRFRLNIAQSRLTERFGSARPDWAIFDDSSGNRHSVRLRWP